MVTFVLLPDAGSDSWYWHRVVPLLRDGSHETVAVNLPCDDDRAGLPEYTETALDAIGERSDQVVVAQSMGGFTTPLIAARVPVDLIVLVAAMVPLPGETPGDGGRPPLDPAEVFPYDVPPAVAAQSAAHVRNQTAAPFERPWPLEA